MKHYEATLLNVFQKAHAPKNVQDEAIEEQRERMADEGIFYRGATYIEESTSPETGIRQRIHYDKNSDKWVAEFHFPDDSTQRLEADSRLALSAAIAAGHAQTVVEAQEAELEANPVFKSDYEKVVFQWLRDCTFGREFSAWSEYLPQGTVDTIGKMIREKAARMFHAGAKLDARNIETAYVELLDAGLLDEFENEAANVKSSREFIAAHPSEEGIRSEEFQQRSEVGYVRAMAEHEAIETRERVAEDKKLSKTKKGLAELRRRALFGSKENAFPISTGTGKRS